MGEIALVVIGILIALQINNWNEERIQRAEEAKTIQFIFDELQANLAYHKGRIIELTYYESLARNILKSTGPSPPELPKDSLFQILHPYEYHSLYAPVIAKFKQLIGSDDINLISSDSLKNLFLQYDALLGLASELQLLLNQSSTRLNEYLDRKGMTRDVLLTPGRVSKDDPWAIDVGRLWEKSYGDLGFSQFTFDIVNLLKDPQFEAVISRRFREVVYSKGRLSTVQDHIEYMIEFIRSNYPVE